MVDAEKNSEWRNFQELKKKAKAIGMNLGDFDGWERMMDNKKDQIRQNLLYRKLKRENTHG